MRVLLGYKEIQGVCGWSPNIVFIGFLSEAVVRVFFRFGDASYRVEGW